MKKKILFLVLHRKDRSPGQRYRHEQYTVFLERNGFECEFSPLLNEKQDKLFYASGNYFQKLFIGLQALFRRWKDAKRAKEFDLVYIYRDAFFFGTFVERWIRESGSKIIYDFDDAIWLNDENPAHGFLNKLKTPHKISKIIAMSHLTIAGNKYLEEYALQFSNSVTIIPSTIDMKIYQTDSRLSEQICIGWTGSFSTLKHFEWIVPVLEKIKLRYGKQVYYKLIGVDDYENERLGIRGIKWRNKTEVADLSELDIGIMPLPDNCWNQGKCGMKGLQYMALGIAAILSPVGVNKDIVIHGKNGMLASDADQWVDTISYLVENSSVRHKLGEEGKKTVMKEYSTEVNKEKWIQAFHS